MQTTLYVIRHGETEWNATGRWQGQLDTPLNDDGRLQARRLARRFATQGPRFDALYSSDLARAFETATIVGGALGHAEVRTLPALREIDIGVWSGLHTDEIRARFADELARIDSGDDLKRGGAESFGDLKRRIAEAVERLAAEHPGETLALFTHGGCVRALHAYAQEQVGDVIERYRGHIGNTSVSVFLCGAGGWRIERMNDLEHLRTVGLTPDDAEKPSEHQV
jgi:broad specificity phosphatase PhoE